MLREYTNEPLTNFSDPFNENAFREALETVKARLGRKYPLVIGGERVQLEETFESVNPSRPTEIIGHFSKADVSHVDEAIEMATETFELWRRIGAEERARYLFRAAAEMRRRKHEFSAMMVLEVGKSWVEADADTAEAIDFIEYYARQMILLEDSSDKLVPYEPEELGLYYLPLGVGAIIPPWNFPCAILTGMTSAAIVAGNTVLLKPAEQSMGIGWMVYELFEQIGLPAGVINFLTGPGEIVGARMVEHPNTRFVAFTGSRQVGTAIYQKTAQVQPGQKWLKRAILEMGGKDAVVVDETADLYKAADAIVRSAFGFQGQKCSAGSRAIIVEEVYEEVKNTVVALARELTVGSPDKGKDINMGPVIDPEAMNKIMNYIEIGTEEGELLLGGNRFPNGGGYYIEPTIFGDVDPDARIAQEEIFGPVLALIKARDYDDALRIANGTEYGLTGAVFSNDQLRLEKARFEYHVGNLYFNRKCTGALVGVHPFGGFNMSGTDSKAGGPDYLLLFTQAKSVAQKL